MGFAGGDRKLFRNDARDSVCERFTEVDEILAAQVFECPKGVVMIFAADIAAMKASFIAVVVGIGVGFEAVAGRHIGIEVED